MAEGLRRVPAWAWLTAIVLGSFAVRAWLARGMAGPFILVDELFYSELGRSLADSGELAIRGARTAGYGLVYPLLIAPAYLVGSLVDAYTLVKVTNALVMSLAAIPAYLLARRVVGTGLAVLAALAAVAVPSMAYTGSVMTENAFYPTVLVVVLLQVRALERPTRGRQLVVLAAVALALLVRVQAGSLLLGVLTAPVVLGAIAGGLKRTLWAHRLTYGIAAVGAVLAVGVQAFRGRSPNDLFGAYAVVGESSYDFGRALDYLTYHLAELDLYLAGVPVAATAVLLTRPRRLDAPLQAFLAGILASSVWIVVVVAVFASRHAFRIQERNAFYVVPLFVIALLAWIERGAPRPLVVAVPAAVGAAAAVLVIPFETFITTSAVSDTLLLLPWWAVLVRTGIEWVPVLVALLMAGFAALFLLVPRRLAILLPVAVLAYWAIAFKPIWFGPYPWGYRQASVGAVFQGIRGVERDWIDAEVGPDADVGVIWTGRPDRMVVNQNEFFNRSVGRVYYTRSPTPGGAGFETPVTIDEESGAVHTPDGRELPERLFLITDASIEPDGTELARDKQLGVSLWRTNGPLVSVTRIAGLYPDDTWSGSHVRYERRRCDGGTLRVELGGDARLFGGPTTVVAVAGAARRAITFHQDERATLSVPLVAARGSCVVRFRVRPTAVPAKVIPDSVDERVLGTHFYAFHYRSAP